MKWKILPKKRETLLEQLLINRGIKNKEDFFNPKIEDYDLKISGITKAQKRILKATKNNELIIVYGDYDVDGICGCAILYKALTSLGAKVLPYIPHREKEGYGLSKSGLEFARDSGASVVITVDNGIVANHQAKFAKEIGLDLIITDHHLPGKQKPDAYEIVHSVKMCGAAVAWCLVRDLIKNGLAKDLLQFVAIATVCDLMPLLNLNRAFVFEGLKILNNTGNLGLQSLIDESGITLGSIGSYEIGHILGPRLNAMGRLEHAIDSLRLLCTKDPAKAKRLSKLLSDTNLERQKQTMDALDEARMQVDKKNNIHVLINKNWNQGIIGLVAGRISDEFNRPVVAIYLGEEISKGSARSVNGVNIVEVIREHQDILIDVGGHPGAAGFSILSKHIEVFKKRLQAHVIDLPETEKVLEIDAEVEIEEITKKLVADLQKFEPFGFGNPRPVFATYSLQISDIRTVGQGKHLKFKIDGIDAIAFGMGELVNMLSNGQTVDLAYTPEIDHYNGSEKLQLKIKDIVVK
ncbi:single-stranded-DNA-specific exonuclease RecJ [Candidatus Daviesbacteria bacterium]|nr:single-stranded-DNA-specific exonuclease RecJ [Candidatus Daviesbacteria bacterium]